MERVPEPELMVDDHQARAYSDADFTEPHQAAVERFHEAFGDIGSGRVLDLGCGPADVTVRFARAFPSATFLGVDGSAAMLALGRDRIEREGMTERVTLEEHLLPSPLLETRGPFDAIISTSVLHHLHEPAVLWQTVAAAAAPGAAVFVQDLLRPASEAELELLVAEHTAGEPEVLRHDYAASLRAAFTIEEVRAQVDDRYTVAAVTDRHLVVIGRT